MRKPDASMWETTEGVEGLVFFAQTFDELLFDHSLDTYRVPALNAHFIVREFRAVAADVERGDLQPGSLRPVAEEIESEIRACPAMREILRPDLDWHIRGVTAFEKNPRAARDHATRILDVAEARYLGELRTQLLDSVPAGRQKESIYKLTRSLVCELINAGYSPGYLYSACRNYRFGRNHVDPKEDLQSFLDLFDLKRSLFTAVISASPTFVITKRFSDIVGIKVLGSAPAALTTDPREMTWLGRSRAGGTQFLVLQDIEATDPYSAASDAVERIRMLFDLTSWHVHREALEWEDEALIVNQDRKTVWSVMPPKLSVHKRPDIQEEGRLSEGVQRFAKAIGMHKLSDRSTASLLRSLRMHADAVRSDQLTTQFVYLWTTIETLAPRDSSKARINTFLDFMVPYLCVGHTAKLLYDLNKCLRSQGKEYLNILHSAGVGRTRTEKLGAILALEAEHERRDKLLEICEKNPLLRNRVYRFGETFSNPKNILKLLKQHETRIRQHVQRMYRVRNMILHSGAAMPYLSTLVENLHDYIDRIIDRIILECDPFPAGHRDTEAVTESINARYKQHLSQLEAAKGDPISEGNVLTLIFGPK